MRLHSVSLDGSRDGRLSIYQNGECRLNVFGMSLCQERVCQDCQPGQKWDNRQECQKTNT